MSVRLAVSEEEASAFDAALLERRAEALLRALGHAGAELSVSLVGDAEMADLNARFRGRRGPTDVLSFSLVEGEHAGYRGALLGDVVIGVAVARRQAKAAGHGLDEELARLLIHGALHVLGHDHERDEDARVMEALERRLFDEIAA